MRIKKIELRNFRNYVNITIEFKNNLNIFIGQNAQGKTNILEAIYFLSMGRSHRTTEENDFIRWSQEACSVEVIFNHQEMDSKLVYTIKKDKKKEITFNEKIIKLREIVGLFNTVLFSPEDLSLIKGNPAGRRRFLDSEISQASPVYYHQLIQYNRILLQRNNLLKKIREKKGSLEILETWDEQLIKYAAKIIKKRYESVKKLSMLANLMHRKITDGKENLDINYQQHELKEKEINFEDWFEKKLFEYRDNDIFRGSTSIGPHRDDLILYVNGINLRTFGSQGQQRTGILALKLAELEFIKSETGEYPVLLLDDVMSELDFSRREQLLSFIKERVQTFITATDIKYFDGQKSGKYYHVVNGTITE